ncbi:Sodium channel modifier 1, acidic C-terminal domain [Dillenia turbinata]|uniref:Sodium channel modifier 1 n=1 Tax=Dillenia turbinata TaxID=194707 RepID=A0AAN8WHK8_9MAGN
MSVFGGDSWGREAQYRKRRVDDLIIDGLDSSSYKKLSNGKFTCLLCPKNPIFDSSLMLSMHNKGARHLAAAAKLKEREISIENEAKKRIALSNCPVGYAAISITSMQASKSVSRPLIQQTRKAVSEVLCKQAPQQIGDNIGCHSLGVTSGFSCNTSVFATKVAEIVPPLRKLDFQERRERELKFTAAGWKRDCTGKWFKDENVEFDSDDEDPNVCLR